MITGHGGNIYDAAQRLGCAPFEIIDMSSNLNPIGPPPGLMAFLEKNLDPITALPEVDAKKVSHAFAGRYDLDPELVLAGNGTTQFIYCIPQALETKRALILGPTYADYADACIMCNVERSYFMAKESQEFRFDINDIDKNIEGFDTVFICNPNNPTGALIPASELEWLLRSHPDKWFIIDESYLPFVNSTYNESMIQCGLANVVVLFSMSKIFRIPGLRIGFLVSSKKTVEKLKRCFLPWSVNSLAQAAVIYLMDQEAEVDTFIRETKRFIETEKRLLAGKLQNASYIKLFPSSTSFALVGLSGNLTADNICTRLSEHRILVRNLETEKTSYVVSERKPGFFVKVKS